LSPKSEYLYNKKELQEELGLYDYGNRYLDPLNGRWDVVDKKAEDPTQISLSPYAYVGNNPINKTDPDGNCPSCIFEATLAIAGGEEGATLGVATPAAIVTVAIGGIAAIGDFFIQSHHDNYHVNSESTHQSTPDKQKSPPNPNGSKGNADHQEKVGQLADKAKAEAKPGEKVITEKKIQVPGSNRRPDVQVLDENGKTVKVHEAERKPNSARNKTREAEYDNLGVDHQTHKVGN
jgi:RHS repeat-associated protein